MTTEQLDGWLSSLGVRLQSPEGRRLLIRSAFHAARRLLWGTTLLYGGALVTLIATCRWIGEGNLTSAFLIFLPPLVWLTPLPLLMVVSVIFSWRLLIAQTALAILFCTVFMDWRMPRSLPSTPAHALTVLTFNRGESKGSLQPFKNHIQPDVIVLEDAGGRADAYLHASGYSEFKESRDLGQFTVLSKVPIESAQLPPMEGLNEPGYPHAARFVLKWEGHDVSLYAVHLPTPRDTLMSCRHGAFLLGVFGFPGTKWAEHRRSYEVFWKHQQALAKALLHDVEQDPNPVILAGDFNAPSCGHVHHLVASQFQDTHEVAGEGFGFSFPGETNDPIALFDAWLRIDYLYCDRHWRPVWCQTEKERPSQHRAVATCFEFLGHT